MMEPYYHDKWVTIYHGDCLKVMLELPKVDVILTDPPYNIGKYYGDGPYSWQDNLPEKQYWILYNSWLRAFYDVTQDRAYIYLSSTSSQTFKIRRLAEKVGFRWLQILIWYGPNTVGGSGYAMPWMQMYEPISLFCKGKRRKMLNAGLETITHDVFVVPRPQRFYREGRQHVVQKPVNLYRRIISRTPSELILDPLMGVGTTLVAAKYFNRKCIGIEIEEKYCEIAARRCSQAVFEMSDGDNKKDEMNRQGALAIV